MTTLLQLQEEWSTDIKYDDSQLDYEVLRNAKLHSKWLDYHTEFRLKEREQEKRILEMEGIRRRYFAGQLSRDELDHHGWEPWNHKEAGTNALKDKQIETDPIMITMNDKMFRYTVCRDYCESVLQFIKFRGQDVRGAIEWRKFANGN